MTSCEKAMNKLQDQLKKVTDYRDTFNRDSDEYKRADKRHVSIKVAMAIIDDYEKGNRDESVKHIIEQWAK